MGRHPLNLALRFFLEMGTLVIMGMWGWKLVLPPLSYLFAVIFPFIAMTIWGVFAVPDDPSRSGRAPIPVAGWLRLCIEAAFFASGIAAMYYMSWHAAAGVCTAVVILHYAISYDRIAWLLKRT